MCQFQQKCESHRKQFKVYSLAQLHDTHPPLTPRVCLRMRGEGGGATPLFQAFSLRPTTPSPWPFILL
jgi:hypothetical protein